MIALELSDHIRHRRCPTSAPTLFNPLHQYAGRWWNCFDMHHASYETNSVEIQMLLNLLCNAHLNTPAQYCCSM
ncbi:hypothetical protein E2C01_042543 [Portunus trituberculatus]|uniref:Uncharacterized protein n=1 Tax=Portunus trituberculatus TaxID=210409 RepID=A0A5B7FM36_PORTR|nr:hypothetical protein [Portunus trituberculatus]